MAHDGYRVEQRPKLDAESREAWGIKGEREPDFLIEGRPFDLYTATSAKPDHIAKMVGTKTNPAHRQADRVIVNLRQTSVTKRQLQDYVQKNPIHGRNELRVVTTDWLGNTVIKTIPRK